MISNREAWIADRIRKTVTFLVSAGGTTLLLRVLYRLAHGRQQLVDLELWGFIALTVMAILWIRATRRMPRSAVMKPGSEPPKDTRSAESPGEPGTPTEVPGDLPQNELPQS